MVPMQSQVVAMVFPVVAWVSLGGRIGIPRDWQKNYVLFDCAFVVHVRGKNMDTFTLMPHAELCVEKNFQSFQIGLPR